METDGKSELGEIVDRQVGNSQQRVVRVAASLQSGEDQGNGGAWFKQS